MAALLSQAGLRVVVLEKGSFTPTEELNQKVGVLRTAQELLVLRGSCHIRSEWLRERCPRLAGGSKEVLECGRSTTAALIQLAACVVQPASRAE